MNFKVKGWINEALPDDDNREQDVQGQTIELFISNDELGRLLNVYDPGSGTSPSVADCRPLVRAILDKLGA